MELVDTHCHLTSLKDVAIDDVFEHARESHVTRFVSIGASEGIRSVHSAIALAEKYSNVWATAGIHPHDAGSFTSVAEIKELAAHPRVVAVGETGLDFFRDWSPRDNQFQLFEETVSLAKEVRKPLIIHCRDAAEETIEVLIRLKASEVGGVFHCYAQDAEFARRLRDLNFLVSFTGNLTFKKAQALRDAVRGIPLEQIMVETDCPYMAPEPFRGKPSEPMHVLQVAQKIAEIKGITLEECAEITTATAVSFFKLS